jgi:hypothetical protein
MYKMEEVWAWVLGVNDPIDVMSIASGLNLFGSSNFAFFVEVCGCWKQAIQ